MGGEFVIKILKQWLLTVLLLVLGTGVGFAAPPVPANPIPIEYVTGVVINIQPMEQTRKIQGVKSVEKATIRLTSGEESGKEVESTIYLMERPGFDVYPDVGDKIIVAISHDMSKKSYNVADYDRFSYVYYLIGAFILSLLAMGGRVGLKSIFVVFFCHIHYSPGHDTANIKVSYEYYCSDPGGQCANCRCDTGDGKRLEFQNGRGYFGNGRRGDSGRYFSLFIHSFNAFNWLGQ